MLGFPPPPPPPPEGLKDWVIVGIVGVGLVAAGFLAVFAIGAFLPLCAGCPGDTPLGVTFSMSDGTGMCPAGNGSTTADCAYTFVVAITNPAGGAPTLTASDLSFQLQGASGTLGNTTFTVGLLTSTGCGLGEWASAGGPWATGTSAANCGAANPHSIPLQSGQRLLLQPGSPTGTPYPTPGDHLIARATGGGFSGTVAAVLT
jgi:hypothetical protein